MSYNFISAIHKGEFSIKEDYKETVKDYEKAWKYVGGLSLDKIVDSTIPILGKINNKTRRQVQGNYLLGGLFGLMSLAQVSHDTHNAKMLALVGILTIGYGAIHQKALSRYEEPPYTVTPNDTS